MINDLGNWSSIIGLIISIITLFYAFFINRRVKNIKKRVMFNTRVAPLFKDLKTYTLNIKKLYEDFENNTDDLKLEITKCRVQLESVVQKIQSEEKEEFELQIKNLYKAQKSKIGEKPDNYKQKWYKRKVNFVQKDDVWEIYVGLTACVNKLDNLIKDKTII